MTALDEFEGLTYRRVKVMVNLEKKERSRLGFTSGWAGKRGLKKCHAGIGLRVDQRGFLEREIREKGTRLAQAVNDNNSPWREPPAHLAG